MKGKTLPIINIILLCTVIIFVLTGWYVSSSAKFDKYEQGAMHKEQDEK